MSRAIAWGQLGALGLLGGVLVGAGARVGALESDELDAEGAWQIAGGPATSGTARTRLLEASLARGEDVTFELCSDDEMNPRVWGATGRISVERVEPPETMFDLPLDELLLSGARRSERGACLTFARVRALGLDEPRARVGVDLSWTVDAARRPQAQVRARILARRALGTSDLRWVWGALFATLLWAGLGALRPPAPVQDARGRAWLRVGAGLGAVLVSGALLGAFAPPGALSGLISGLALAAVEVAAAFALVRAAGEGRRGSALGLDRPAGRVVPWAWFVAAPCAGIVLYAVARASLAMIPSTGEAPVEAFVSWPSGMLSFAVLAVAAPAAEEVFFRGLLFGVLRGPGGPLRGGLAVVGAWWLFAAVHVPQDWGNWGGLAAVLVAGLGFTLLRALSGSTLVPIVAHLVYNGLLAGGAVASSTLVPIAIGLVGGAR